MSFCLTLAPGTDEDTAMADNSGLDFVAILNAENGIEPSSLEAPPNFNVSMMDISLLGEDHSGEDPTPLARGTREEVEEFVPFHVDDDDDDNPYPPLAPREPASDENTVSSDSSSEDDRS